MFGSSEDFCNSRRVLEYSSKKATSLRAVSNRSELIFNAEMCRYDRSLWPDGTATTSAQALTESAACNTGTGQEAQPHAVSQGALQSLKQRMATVLDVEVCGAG